MSNKLYENILTKGYYSSLTNTPVENDKIRVTKDTNQLFVDFDGERKEISDIIKGMSEDEILSVLAPLPNKLYLSTDTERLLMFNGDEWVVVGEKNKSGNVPNADYAVNAGTAEYTNNASTAQYSNLAGSATNASTATYAVNAGTAEYTNNASTAEYASVATNASTATYAVNAGTAEYTNNAASATNASTATYATNAGTATSATSATNASTAVYANTAANADYATNADNATNASTATYASSANTANSATKATKDANGKQINTTYAPLASPILTGTPTVPTPATGNNSKQIANTEYVVAAIAAAIGEITKFDTEITTSLPETGVKGVIYFVLADSSETNNIYDEYLWVDSKFEKIGTTKIDLSNYVNEIETTGTGNAITSFTKSGNKITAKKSSTFLTKHPSITSTASTGTENPGAGGTFNVVDSISIDDNGHLTGYRTKTVTMSPNTNTTYADYKGSTTAAAGTHGLVPAATSGAANRYLRCDGTWVAPPNTNTTYAVMTGATSAAAGTAGLVPAPSSGAQSKFLRGDGTWQTPTNTTYANMTGATTAANGTHGLVPAPTSGAANRYLRSDGTWQVPPDTNTNTTYADYSGATTAAAGTHGLVPSAETAARLKFLRGDGTWQTPTNTTYADYSGATSAAAGTHGLVPAATSGSQNKFLRGDGTWQTPANTTYADYKGSTTAAAGTHGLVPAATSGAANRYLRSDGTWQVPPNSNTTYAVATTAAAGLGPKRDASTGTHIKEDGSTESMYTKFLRGDGTYNYAAAYYLIDGADLDFGSLDANG